MPIWSMAGLSPVLRAWTAGALVGQCLPPRQTGRPAGFISTLEGEMVVSDRQRASAYWQGPDKLVPMPQDGFRNGDLARQDDEGYVYITGRKKDIIIMGGVNIRLARHHELPARARRCRRRRHARGEG